jgi:hypothetical protein
MILEWSLRGILSVLTFIDGKNSDDNANEGHISSYDTARF